VGHGRFHRPGPKNAQAVIEYLIDEYLEFYPHPQGQIAAFIAGTEATEVLTFTRKMTESR
jgi:hypothetical protein